MKREVRKEWEALQLLTVCLLFGNQIFQMPGKPNRLLLNFLGCIYTSWKKSNRYSKIVPEGKKPSREETFVELLIPTNLKRRKQAPEISVTSCSVERC